MYDLSREVLTVLFRIVTTNVKKSAEVEVAVFVQYMAKDRTVRGHCQEEICSASLVARCPKRNSLPKTIGRIPKIGNKWRFAECVQKCESSTQYV